MRHRLFVSRYVLVHYLLTQLTSLVLALQLLNGHAAHAASDIAASYNNNALQHSHSHPIELPPIDSTETPSQINRSSVVHVTSDSSNSSASTRADNNDHDGSALFASVTMLHPANSSFVKCPIVIQYHTQVVSMERVTPRYSHLRACVELDRAAEHPTRCYPVLGVPIHMSNLSPGVHSLRVVTVDTNEAIDASQEQQPQSQSQLLQWEILWSDIASRASVLRTSDVTHFTVLSEPEFATYRSAQLQHQRHRHQLPPPEHDDIVEWAQLQRMKSFGRDTKPSPVTLAVDVVGEFVLVDEVVAADVAVQPHHLTLSNQQQQQQQQQTIDPDRRTDPFVVIGVKTSVVHGFAQRQSIRESWASASARHSDVRVVFVGCRPERSLLTVANADRTRLAEAIETEKRTFRDLLTHELDCDDSYYALVDKVKAFLHFATTTFPAASYIMVVDDDVYVRTHELVELIHRESWPRTRVYTGHIVGFGAHVAPIRDPGHKNYLAVEQYALDALPPYAFGCHYMLSHDCAQFIGRNRARLQGLAHLDDVSVALWMFALQVHPRHIDAFAVLDVHGCVDSAISLADLSPSAMRVAHASLVAGNPLCTHFDRSTWRKAQQHSPDEQTVAFSSVVKWTYASHTTHVVVNVTSDAGTLQFSYDTAAAVLDNEFVHALCLRVRHAVVPGGFACADFARRLRHYMLTFAAETQRDGNVGRAHLVLWQHNLQFVGERVQLIVAVISSNAMQYKSMVECLLAAMYRQHPIRVLDEAAFVAENSVLTTIRAPDIVVFADSDCESHQTDQATRCKQTTQTFIDRFSDTAALIMISGEHWDVDTLDERVLLLSTVSDVARHKHVYVPMASMVFSSLRISPMVLLENSAERVQRQHLPSPSERKFCAYMYARCDQPQREYMFDLLNAMERVDALGVCQGSSQPERPERWLARVDSDAFSAAIEMYTQYKFVIAFENAQLRPGYVTEKLVTAFLAGSIPVYLGHSHSLAHVFNPASFIDCGTFATLRACALRVLQVHRSPELYAHMLREPVVANATLFLELFSWHPDVPSSHISDEVERLLQR